MLYTFAGFGHIEPADALTKSTRADDTNAASGTTVSGANAEFTVQTNTRRRSLPPPLQVLELPLPQSVLLAEAEGEEDVAVGEARCKKVHATEIASTSSNTQKLTEKLTQIPNNKYGNRKVKKPRPAKMLQQASGSAAAVASRSRFAMFLFGMLLTIGMVISRHSAINRYELRRSCFQGNCQSASSALQRLQVSCGVGLAQPAAGNQPCAFPEETACSPSSRNLADTSTIRLPGARFPRTSSHREGCVGVCRSSTHALYTAQTSVRNAAGALLAGNDPSSMGAAADSSTKATIGAAATGCDSVTVKAGTPALNRSRP